MTSGDFELFDNGARQAISVLTVDAVPVDVTLVVAQTAFMQQVGSRLAAELSRAVSRLRQVDRLRVITFARNVRELLPLQPWSHWPAEPSAPDALEKLLKAEWLEEPRRAFEFDPQLNPWSLHDALLMALAKPPKLGRRHLIVGISLGVDSHSVLNDGEVFQTIAARSDALMHVVLAKPRIGGQLVEALHMRYPRLVITAAAEATGGQVHEFDPVGALRRVLDAHRQSYLLQYTLTGVPPHGWHDVVVRTPKFPNYTVRARKGYQGR